MRARLPSMEDQADMVLNDKGRTLISELRNTFSEFNATEESLLVERENRTAAAAARSIWIVILGTYLDAQVGALYLAQNGGKPSLSLIGSYAYTKRKNLSSVFTPGEQAATKSYQESGGKASFSEYYHADYGAAAMDGSLKKRITFANHNLATDNSFGEMHLVFCRNVLIYFNRDLQNRALKLFTESLVHGGFLCLGTKEALQFTDVYGDYEPVDEKAKIYKKSERGGRSR